MFFFSSFFLQAGIPQAPQEMPSPEELQAMVEDIEKNDPELFKLLQEEGRRILQEAGIDPDSFEQPKAEIKQEEKKAPLSVPEKTQSPLIIQPTTEVKQTVRGIREIEHLLQSLIESLQSMRLKAHVNTSIARLLERFKRELDDLSYYLPIIKNKPIITYLATSAYTSFYMKLKSFTHKIGELEQQLMVNDLYAEKHDTPYHILAVRPGSSLKEIEAAYKRMMKAKNPQELKKQLKKEGFSLKEQKAILQENELQRRAIQEAYDLLTDINTKKRFDRDHEFTVSQRLSGGTVSKELLSSIGKAFTDFMYNERSLEDIKKLIAQYDPEAAKHKMKIEEEIKQERERVEEAKKRPQQPSPRAPFSPRTYYPEARAGSYQGGYSGGGYSPDYSSYNQPYGQTAAGTSPSQQKPKDAGSAKPDAKKEDKDKDKDKDKDDKKDKDKKDKDDKKTRSKDRKEKDIKTYIEDCVKPLRKTEHMLTGPDLYDIKGADRSKAKKVYDTLDLDTLIEKLSALSEFLIDPKNKEKVDKEKKESAQQWKLTVLVRSKTVLEKINNLLPKKEEEPQEDAPISYQEILARDFDNLRTQLDTISKALGLKSDAQLKSIFDILKQPQKTDTFNRLLIDVQKQINKEDGADLKTLQKNLHEIFGQIGGLNQDQKERQKTAWKNKIVTYALPFVTELSAPKEKKRSVIDAEAKDKPDQVDTILSLFKDISQTYGMIDLGGDILDQQNEEFLEVVRKGRRINPL